MTHGAYVIYRVDIAIKQRLSDAFILHQLCKM